MVSSLQVFQPKLFLCISHFSHVCYMLCPSHPFWVDQRNNVWWNVQVVNLLIMQYKDYKGIVYVGIIICTVSLHSTSLGSRTLLCWHLCYGEFMKLESYFTLFICLWLANNVLWIPEHSLDILVSFCNIRPYGYFFCLKWGKRGAFSLHDIHTPMFNLLGPVLKGILWYGSV